MDASGFEWLAQGFQDFSIKFSQLIKKKNALMGKADFSGPRRIATCKFQRYLRKPSAFTSIFAKTFANRRSWGWDRNEGVYLGHV